MPCYVFECPDCKTQVERILAVDARNEHKEVCSCGQMCRRIITAANFDADPFFHGAILENGKRVRGEWVK